jgi:sulfatase modifying factor 1
MKTLKLALLLTFTLQPLSRAQEARFFRVVGPVATTITGVSAAGYIAWTNVLTNATFTVQTAQSLLGPGNWVDYIQVPVTNPATTHRLFDLNPPSGMAFIPAGSFMMGNCMDTNEGRADELPLHSVHVSAFYMDRYEVTKALWDEVYNWATNRPVNLRYTFDYTDSGQGKASTHPAQMMTWYDMVKWCNARSEKEGRVPAYYTDAAQTNVYRSGQTNVQNDWVKWTTGYRLPTEAEWEKAARGGVSGHRFPWVASDDITHSQANYFSTNSYAYDTSLTRGYHPTFATGDNPYTGPVGYFAPNGYGLYDMAGNAWEWCWDWYSDSYYSSSPTNDPPGPTSGTSGLYRIYRGASWASNAFRCRSAFRGSYNPTLRINSLGLRPVLPLGQ